MDLSGTLKTPLGDVSKKTAILGGGAAVIAAIIWYRSYQAKQAKAASVAAAGQSEINPATGYPYGSAEDAAALSAQAGYQFPTGGGGGTSGGTGTVGTGFVTNAQWSQAVLDYWQANSLGEPALMSAALGVYLAGGVPTDDQTKLIQQAIAIENFPPQAGSNGYPPHINTAPPGNTNPPPAGGGDTPAPQKVWHVTKGWHVSNWIVDVRSQTHHPEITYESIAAMNPGMSNNIMWSSGGRALRTDETYFKNDADYRVFS